MSTTALNWMMDGPRTPADRWDRATFLFDLGEHVAAARELESLTAEEPATTAVLLLLARAYYHSAQLGRAEQTARDLLAEAPSDGYAHLLLGRTLQRGSRHDEATPHLRLAAAMGVTA